VVVSTGGTSTIAHSIDKGVSWVAQPTQTAVGIAYGQGKWLLFGGGTVNSPSVYYSTSGTSGWALRSCSGSCDFFKGTTGAYSSERDQWISVGEVSTGSSTIARSSDGIVWTAVTSSLFQTNTGGSGVAGGLSVTYGAGLWVAVGRSADSDTVASSPDGVTWTGRGRPFGEAGHAVLYISASIASFLLPTCNVLAIPSYGFHLAAQYSGRSPKLSAILVSAPALTSASTAA